MQLNPFDVLYRHDPAAGYRNVRTILANNRAVSNSSPLVPITPLTVAGTC